MVKRLHRTRGSMSPHKAALKYHELTEAFDYGLAIGRHGKVTYDKAGDVRVPMDLLVESNRFARQLFKELQEELGPNVSLHDAVTDFDTRRVLRG